MVPLLAVVRAMPAPAASSCCPVSPSKPLWVSIEASGPLAAAALAADALIAISGARGAGACRRAVSARYALAVARRLTLAAPHPALSRGSA